MRKRFGVCATLFALLIQFVASFGHVHVGHVGPQTTQGTELVRTTSPDRDRVRAPFGGNSHETDGYICDICATLNLIGSAQITMPPEVPPLFALHTAEMGYPAETAPAELRRINFRSRAPPFA
jgi:hypothetical protein